MILTRTDPHPSRSIVQFLESVAFVGFGGLLEYSFLNQLHLYAPINKANLGSQSFETLMVTLYYHSKQKGPGVLTQSWYFHCEITLVSAFKGKWTWKKEYDVLRSYMRYSCGHIPRLIVGCTFASWKIESIYHVFISRQNSHEPFETHAAEAYKPQNLCKNQSLKSKTMDFLFHIYCDSVTFLIKQL